MHVFQPYIIKAVTMIILICMTLLCIPGSVFALDFQYQRTFSEQVRKVTTLLIVLSSKADAAVNKLSGSVTFYTKTRLFNNRKS